MFIESSKDILYLVIAFCILWFTVFVCWVIYYIAMMLRDARKIVLDVKHKLELIEEVIVSLKESLEHSRGYMKLFVESALKVMEFVKERKEKKKVKAKKKK